MLRIAMLSSLALSIPLTASAQNANGAGQYAPLSATIAGSQVIGTFPTPTKAHGSVKCTVGGSQSSYENLRSISVTGSANGTTTIAFTTSPTSATATAPAAPAEDVTLIVPATAFCEVRQ